MTCRRVRIALSILLIIMIPSITRAAILTANLSGVFSAESTLGGTPFGVDTPFVMRALFDTTTDVEPSLVTGLFDAVVEFDIDGIGTFQSDPTGDVNLLTYVDGVFNGIGLSDSDITNGFIAYYESAVPPFDPSFPWPSELSTYLSSSVSLPFTIALSNGNGDLIIRGIESFDDNASLSSNPEPSTIAIWSLLGLVGLGYGWRKKRKAA
jgi:hypothetical protein